MVSKDQAIGGVICLVCVLVAIGYTILVIFPGEVMGLLQQPVTAQTTDSVRILAVVIPVLVAFIAILAIGAWIGWTMATTPPPKPIEEITTEMEEKKEEPKMEEPKAEEPASTPMTEEKKPEKKKKS
jgi:predicted DNA-binding transcriptional regulator